jgi:hypothetical protein
MPAHVQEAAQHALAVANEQHRHAAHRGRRPAAIARQVVGDGRGDPGRTKDSLSFEGKTIRVGVPRGRQRACGSDAGRVVDVTQHVGAVSFRCHGDLLVKTVSWFHGV